MIRRADASDAHALASLLTERDGRRRTPNDVAQGLSGLDEADIAAWIATVDDRPAACTAMFLRSLRTPRQRDEFAIGYWAHLFVMPEHRKRMLYPQLVFAMRKAMADLGVRAIITAMRRPEVTEGHLKLGFAKLCVWPVLFKPIRPFQLLAKHRGLPGAKTIAPLGDMVWMLLAGFRGSWNRPRPVETMPAERVVADGALLESIASFLCACAPERVATDWTLRKLARRLAGGVEGQAYTVHLVRDDADIRGVAVTTRATRGHDIDTGVLLELAAYEDDADILRALLVASERSLRRAGAEVVLWLDGAGHATSRALRRGGYRTAADEQYTLIAYSPDDLGPILPDDPQAWRFTFLDHDAF